MCVMIFGVFTIIIKFLFLVSSIIFCYCFYFHRLVVASFPYAPWPWAFIQGDISNLYEYKRFILKEVTRWRYLDYPNPKVSAPTDYIYPLYWMLTIHPHVWGGGWKYFLLFEAHQLQRKEPWYPISILGWIVKSEAMLTLYNIKVLAFYDSLALA